MAFVSGEFLALFGLLVTLFFGGCRGWKTGGGSNGNGGLKVRLCVGRAEGGGALTFLIGETFQLRSSQGKMCWPTKCSLPLCGFFVSIWRASSFGLAPSLSAYGRREAAEDVVLARLRSPIRNGLPVVVLKRLARVNGLSRVAVDSRLVSDRWAEANGETSGVRGVASKSSRLINEAKSSVAASRTEMDMAPWKCQQEIVPEMESILTFHIVINSLRPWHIGKHLFRHRSSSRTFHGCLKGLGAAGVAVTIVGGSLDVDNRTILGNDR